MLKAYFDDSGTHHGADVIVMGGLISTDEEWAALEPKWQAALDEIGIKKMHMSPCENRKGEFQRFERPERDAIVARFTDLVCETRGRMLASAVSRDVWNRVADETAIREWFPEPIDFLFNCCMRRALESRRLDGPPAEELVVVFDSRDESLPFWRELGASYERNWGDKLAGYSFGQMQRVLPLQAADIVAYETFVHQCRCEQAGEPVNPRPNLYKLMAGLDTYAGFYDYDNLLDYALKLEA